MKIAILGAGAMGSLYASYLSGKHHVTLVDSYKPQVDKINSEGIIKVEKDQSEVKIAGKAVLSGTDIGVQDMVIVFVKSTNTFEAVSENKRLFGVSTIAMTLQNGAGNNHEIEKFVSKEHIIVGTSSHNSVAMGLGKFFHSGCGPTNIGPHFPCEESDCDVKKVDETLRECGLEVNIIEDIQRVLWQKLFINSGINAISTLMQCKIGEVNTNPYLWELCRKVVYECVLVAEADGTYFDRREVLEIVRKVCKSDAEGYASMCQDRKNKRLTEIDKINGVVAKLGQEYGIYTPYNNMLVTQIHATEHMYLI